MITYKAKITLTREYECEIEADTEKEARQHLDEVFDDEGLLSQMLPNLEKQTFSVDKLEEVKKEKRPFTINTSQVTWMPFEIEAYSRKEALEIFEKIIKTEHPEQFGRWGDGPTNVEPILYHDLCEEYDDFAWYNRDTKKVETE